MSSHPPKYPSSPHWVTSPEVHRDDSTHQDPEFFLGKEVGISEKLDGGNTCLNAGEVYARSTGQPATQGWFAMVKKHHAWKTTDVDPNISIYGEDLYGIHSIVYDPLKEDETYRVFNIREQDVWMGLDQREAFARSLGFLTVPLLFRGTFTSVKEITKWFESHINQPSALGPQREGFVMQLTEPFHTDDFSKSVAKYVRKGHVQTDQHWTRNWKTAELIR
jgi:hypothetical protein